MDGFSSSLGGHSLFVKKTGSSFIALLVYVDDILIASNDVEVVCSVKTLLHKSFKIKDLGNARFFLGLEIAWNATGIALSHKVCSGFIG